MAYEALVAKLGERGPSLFDVLIRNRPVNLIQVDRVHSESPQAVLGLTKDRIALEAVHDSVVGTLELGGLGEHIRSLGEALKRAADDLLGATEAVDGGSVDP